MLLLMIYYAGIASCGMQGAVKAQTGPCIKSLMSSFIAAFGGGLIRDLVLLRTYPAAFTLSCVPDILIALFSGIIYTSMRTQKVLARFSIIADAAALGQFISIGVDKAVNMDANSIVAFFCGVITALGGGILSSLCCGISPRTVLSSNIAYRCWTIGGTFIYMSLINLGLTRLAAQTIIVIYTLITTIVCNPSVNAIIKKYIVRTTLTIQQIGSFQPLNTLWKMVILAMIICCHRLLYRIKNVCCKNIQAPFVYTRKTFFLRRIRQM